MIVVIQCAAKKSPQAGYLQTSSGKNVFFVADPSLAPVREGIVYAHPDDIAEDGNSWREKLLEYNESPGENPLGLLPAWQLYGNSTYELLMNRFGTEKLYILSAGWGLIPADFLTPDYDITFSASAEKYKRRRKADRYNDFEMLDNPKSEPVVFFGGKDYISLFCELTKTVKGLKTVFFNSATPPSTPGCTIKRFVTRTRTNWHYECAKAFIAEEIGV